LIIGPHTSRWIAIHLVIGEVFSPVAV